MEGRRCFSRKVEAVEKFPTPQNQHNVCQTSNVSFKKDASWIWGAEKEAAFRNLQQKLIQKPALALYDSQAATELHTDACKVSLGGILLQRNDYLVLRPVAYFTRQTTPEEQNYSFYDMETLAVVSALQKFRVYLFGIKFKIVTDCNSLRRTLQKRDMIPRMARCWQ